MRLSPKNTHRPVVDLRSSSFQHSRHQRMLWDWVVVLVWSECHEFYFLLGISIVVCMHISVFQWEPVRIDLGDLLWRLYQVWSWSGIVRTQLCFCREREGWLKGSLSVLWSLLLGHIGVGQGVAFDMSVLLRRSLMYCCWVRLRPCLSLEASNPRKKFMGPKVLRVNDLSRSEMALWIRLGLLQVTSMSSTYTSSSM